MKIRIHTIILFFIVFLANLTFGIAQQNDKISFFKLNKKTAVVVLNSRFDTLVAHGLGKKLTFLKINKKLDRIYISNQIIPGLDSFSNAYVSLEIWEVFNDDLKSSKLKLYLNNQKAKNVKINFLPNGVNIILKKSIFRKLIYFIPYDYFEKSESFTLP